MELKLEDLTHLGTEAVQNAIREYTNWYVVSASLWVVFGMLMLYTSQRAWEKRKEIEPCAVIAPILLVCGLLSLVANLPTLISPRAYAIHQLLKDICGN